MIEDAITNAELQSEFPEDIKSYFYLKLFERSNSIKFYYLRDCFE